MAKWVLTTNPEMIPVAVDPHEFDQVLAGVSEILYRVFRQLDPRVKNPKTLSTGTNVTDCRDDAVGKPKAGST